MPLGSPLGLCAWAGGQQWPRQATPPTPCPQVQWRGAGLAVTQVWVGVRAARLCTGAAACPLCSQGGHSGLQDRGQQMGGGEWECGSPHPVGTAPSIPRALEQPVAGF